MFRLLYSLTLTGYMVSIFLSPIKSVEYRRAFIQGKYICKMDCNRQGPGFLNRLSIDFPLSPKSNRWILIVSGVDEEVIVGKECVGYKSLYHKITEYRNGDIEMKLVCKVKTREIILADIDLER